MAKGLTINSDCCAEVKERCDLRSGTFYSLC